MKTKLITREGYNKLKEELDFLWRQERPEVTKKVAWAIVLVYVIPVVLFLTGYFLGQQWGCGNLIGVLGFFLGLALAVLESRRQKKRGQEIRYQIVSYA